MSFRSSKNDENILPFPGRNAVASAAAASLPVLIVLHQETSTPGRVGNALRALGYPLDIRRPRFGDPLPDTLERHAGAVIFGGPMSANDPDDYVRREIDWIEIPLREQRPFLGICLGAQMLAKQLGAQVAPHHEGRVEVGYYPIRPTADGHAFGFQFHPDVTYAMMHRWTTRGGVRMDSPGAQPRHLHFEGRAVHDVIERAWLKNFIAGWIARAPRAIMLDAAE